MNKELNFVLGATKGLPISQASEYQEIATSHQKLLGIPLLNEGEEYILIKNSKSKNPKTSKIAIDQLYRHFFKLILKEANKFFRKIGKKTELKDLLSEATIGFLTAIKNFDLNKWGEESSNGMGKIRFSSYVKSWIYLGLCECSIQNSSLLKYCTTHKDRKVFNNIAKVLKKLKINKTCCELDRIEILKVANELVLHPDYIYRYIYSVNFQAVDYNWIDESQEQKLKKIEDNIDRNKVLDEEEKTIYNEMSKGKSTNQIADVLNSNRETIRQKRILIVKKINEEKIAI